MKKPSRRLLFNLGMFGLLLLIYIVCSSFLHLPGYMILLIYAVIILATGFLYRKDLFAVMGNLTMVRGEKEKALQYLKKATDMHTKSPVAHLNYGILLLRDGNWEKSLAMLEKAEALNQGNIMNDKNILLSKGSCYWVKGDIPKAIETLEGLKAKYEYVNGNVLTTLGYMYFLQGEYDKSLELTNQAIEDMPESGAAWDNLGQIYYRTNQLDKAKEAFLKALELKSSLVDSLYFLGEIYENEGSLDEAKACFQKAKAADITFLNTVKVQQVEQKYNRYFS